MISLIIKLYISIENHCCVPAFHVCFYLFLRLVYSTPQSYDRITSPLFLYDLYCNSLTTESGIGILPLWSNHSILVVVLNQLLD